MGMYRKYHAVESYFALTLNQSFLQYAAYGDITKVKQNATRVLEINSMATVKQINPGKKVQSIKISPNLLEFYASNMVHLYGQIYIIIELL